MSSGTEDLEAALQKLTLAKSPVSAPEPRPRRSSPNTKQPQPSYTQEGEDEEMVKRKRTPARSAGPGTSGVGKKKTITKTEILAQFKKGPTSPISFRKPELMDCKDMYTQDTSSENKVAYYLSGPAGAGKSTIYSATFSKQKHSYYNVDTYYEYLLNINHLLMKQKEAETYQSLKEEIKQLLLTPELGLVLTDEQLDFLTNRNIKSIKSSLMARAQKCIKEDMQTILSTLPTLVIDKPAAKFDVIKKDLYTPLAKRGYTQYMIFVYTPLFTALKNNRCRSEEKTCGRSIYDFIILDSWIDSMKNVEKFKELFGEENIFFIDNSRGTTMSFEKEEIIEGLKNYDIQYISKYTPYIQATKETIEGMKFVTIEEVKEKLGI